MCVYLVWGIAGAYALDTDSTLVMAEDDSQIAPPCPEDEPSIKRVLFPEEATKPAAIDLLSPDVKRPVARPLAALKEKLAKNAEQMRKAKANASSRSEPASASGHRSKIPDAKSEQNMAESNDGACPRTPDAKSKLNMAESHDVACPRTPDAKSKQNVAELPMEVVQMAQEQSDFLTRREQLTLRPEPKAKGKAKAKAKAKGKAAKNGEESNTSGKKGNGKGKKRKVPAAEEHEADENDQSDEKHEADENDQADEKAMADKKDQADEKAMADKKDHADEKAMADKDQADEKAVADKDQADEKAAPKKKTMADKKADKKAAPKKKAMADKKAARKKKAMADNETMADKKAIADEKAIADKKAVAARHDEMDPDSAPSHAVNMEGNNDEGPKKKPRKCAGPKPGANDRRSSETCQTRNLWRQEARALRNGKAIEYMTAVEIMDTLHKDDLAMQIVLDMMASLDTKAPTKDQQEGLPAYQTWQLSTYWSRSSVGAIRKVGPGPGKYVATFASGGSEGMAIALEALKHFAAGPIYSSFHEIFTCLLFYPGYGQPFDRASDQHLYVYIVIPYMMHVQYRSHNMCICGHIYVRVYGYIYICTYIYIYICS